MDNHCDASSDPWLVCPCLPFDIGCDLFATTVQIRRNREAVEHRQRLWVTVSSSDDDDDDDDGEKKDRKPRKRDGVSPKDKHHHHHHHRHHHHSDGGTPKSPGAGSKHADRSYVPALVSPCFVDDSFQ